MSPFLIRFIRNSLLMVSLIVALITSPVSAQENTIDALQEAVVGSCPSFWEDIHSQIDVAQRTGDLWEGDDDGYNDYLAFVTEAMGENAPDAQGLAAMANDRLTVATECATQRAALMQVLMERMPNDIMIAMNSVGAGLGTAIGQPLGTQGNPAFSCKEIKEVQPDSLSGVYFIEYDLQQDGNKVPFEVFCEMEASGGGWTLNAFAPSGPSKDFTGSFWSEAKSPELLATDLTLEPQVRSLGLTGKLNATEMMVTLNTPDPSSAETLNKLVQYRYSVTNPSFTTGPIPCVPSAFEYRLSLLGDYAAGVIHQCSTGVWYSKDSTGNGNLFLIHQSLGPYWGAGMGGDNSWYHPAWFYIR